MVKSKFLDFCLNVWKNVGINNVQGHSFRIGSAVHLLSLGVAPEYITALGGWTSLAFLLYWRQLIDIVPAAIHKALDLDKVKQTVEEFHKKNSISNALLDTAASGINCTPDDFLPDSS
ncbi:hypothetical protein D9758_000555 [Tetrapyrgos nigripes]|uniref:Tyr recombinase domain-containing protein n=1 Tax=Tetrapyrgos nigripes TaxID=182062 RepID=A0A8H5H1M7_9AGAR|nr:hypothetical protein D9758_000555 [Tetrapyrgos nigripes]